MKLEGNLIKMRTEAGQPVDYYLRLTNEEMHVNDLIGRNLKIEYTGAIHCIACGRKTNKSFHQGFCFSCFKTAPEADESVVRPELSMAQFGVARDLAWSEEHDLIEHYVYLSLTSGLKVGVTRHHQIPTRWIDQGTSQAIKLALTPNRHIAGIIESYLKHTLADKTKWKDMLISTGETTIDLIDEKKKAAAILHPELQKYVFPGNEVYRIQYPGVMPDEILQTVSLDKQAVLQGTLSAIKGQYLVFDNGAAFNVRKHNGYEIVVTF